MIVLKHLSRQYDIDPPKLRSLLRRQFGKRARWQWEDGDKELKLIHDMLSPGTKPSKSTRKRSAENTPASSSPSRPPSPPSTSSGATASLRATVKAGQEHIDRMVKQLNKGGRSSRTKKKS